MFFVYYVGPFGAYIHTLKIWGSGYYTITDYVIARDINVNFRIFSFLKYDNIFGKNLEHGPDGVK